MVRSAARAVPAAVVTVLRRVLDSVVVFVRRCSRTGRGRMLLVSAAAVLVAVPTGTGFAVAALTSGSEESGDAVATGAGVAKLGLLVPLSGAHADVGMAVRNAVELAVDEANESRSVPGWRIELVVHDDLSRPDGGASAAEKLAADDAVVGVVGPLSSTVAMSALPALAEAGVAVVSPSNSRPDLTGIGGDDADRKRAYRTYFRLSGTDDFEASAAAEYAVGTLGRSRVAVVDSGPDYGADIARRFTRYVERFGAQVTSVYRPEGGGNDDEQAAAAAAALLDHAPDLVYVAAGTDFAVKLRKHLASELPSIPVLGSDALFDGRYVRGAGPAAEGDVVTDLGIPVAEMPASGAFVAAYAQRWFDVELDGRGQAEPSGGDTAGPTDLAASGPGSGSRSGPGSGSDSDLDPGPGPGSDSDSGVAVPGPVGPSAPQASATQTQPRAQPQPQLRQRAEERIPAVAAYAYDAARALVRAVAVALSGRVTVDAAARDEVVSAVGRGRFAGVTGTVAFDRWGDTVAPAVTIYTVLDERFVPLRMVRG